MFYIVSRMFRENMKKMYIKTQDLTWITLLNIGKNKNLNLRFTHLLKKKKLIRSANGSFEELLSIKSKLDINSYYI